MMLMAMALASAHYDDVVFACDVTEDNVGKGRVQISMGKPRNLALPHSVKNLAVGDIDNKFGWLVGRDLHGEVRPTGVIEIIGPKTWEMLIPSRDPVDTRHYEFRAETSSVVDDDFSIFDSALGDCQLTYPETPAASVKQ